MTQIVKKTFQESMENSIGKNFSNSGKQNYCFFLRMLFKVAKKNINMMITDASSIDPYLNDNDIQLFQRFIDNGGEFNLYSKTGFENSKFNRLKNITHTQMKTQIYGKDGVLQQFLTWDGHGYRFSQNAKKFSAIVCPNDPQFVKLCDFAMLKSIS